MIGPESNLKCKVKPFEMLFIGNDKNNRKGKVSWITDIAVHIMPINKHWFNAEFLPKKSIGTMRSTYKFTQANSLTHTCTHEDST